MDESTRGSFFKGGALGAAGIAGAFDFGGAPESPPAVKVPDEGRGSSTRSCGSS